MTFQGSRILIFSLILLTIFAPRECSPQSDGINIVQTVIYEKTSEEAAVHGNQKSAQEIYSVLNLGLYR